MSNNIILQHWNGDLNELTELSVNNIRQYARRIGADYELIRGKPFRSHLTSPCQKVHCISNDFAWYDQVLMLDPDVFTVKGLDKNIFNESGNGIHGPVQKRLKKRLISQGRMAKDSPYWGGSIYKFNNAERYELRKMMPANDGWLDFYNKAYHYEDEGILAYLASRAGIHENYLDFRWNQCSYLPKPEEAFMIHIRTKKMGMPNGSWDNGGKQPKIDNYKYLVEKGII